MARASEHRLNEDRRGLVVLVTLLKSEQAQMRACWSSLPGSSYWQRKHRQKMPSGTGPGGKRERGEEEAEDVELIVMAGRSRRAAGTSSPAPQNTACLPKLLAENHLLLLLATGQEQTLPAHRAVSAEGIALPRGEPPLPALPGRDDEQTKAL